MALGAAVLLVPEALHAQVAETRGLVLGASVEYLGSRTDSLPNANGAGVSGFLGFGVTRNAMVLFGVGVGASDEGLLPHAELAGRLYAPLSKRLAPYAQVGFASHGRERDETLLSGTGLSLGGGIEYFVLPHRSIAIGLHRWTGKIGEERERMGAATTRLTVGLQLRPPMPERPGPRESSPRQ